MFCQKCGKQLADNAKYCTYCGQKINTDNMDISVQKFPEPKQRKKVWIVLLIAILGITISVVCTLMKMKKDNSNQESELSVWGEQEIEEVEDIAEEESKIIYLLTKDTLYDTYGNIQTESEYEYDAKGNRIKEVSSGIYGGSMRFWEYDEWGNEIRSVWCDEEGKVNTKWEYAYNAQGNLVKETHYNYDANGDIGSVFIITYDEYGNEINRLHKDSEGERDSDESEYGYDEQGNIIREYNYSNGKLWQWTEYEYDEQGNEIKNVSYRADGSKSSWEEKRYDIKGNLVEESSYADTLGNRKTEYEYDTKGNVLKQIGYYEGDVRYIYEFEYDTQGNLLREVSYNAEGNITDQWEGEYITMEIPKEGE